MKFLQLNTPNNEPRILELGKDFDEINYDESLDYPNIDLTKLSIIDDDGEFTTVAYLMDCYKSRPLIEIDGYCEFDVLRYADTMRMEGFYILFLPNKIVRGCFGFTGEPSSYQYNDIGKEVNCGSIFTPENSKKHFELYQQALEIINQNAH